MFKVNNPNQSQNRGEDYQLQEIRDNLIGHFSDSEFKDLCFECFGEALNNIPEQASISTKARELVIWCKNRGKLEELKECISDLRPQSRWKKPIHSRSLPRANPNFFGRQSEFYKLMSLLSPNDRNWIIEITGLGGIGKTALAIHCAYEALTRGYFDSVVFISAKKDYFEGEEIKQFRDKEVSSSLNELIAGTIKSIGFAPKDSLSQDIDFLLNLLNNTCTLLIYDNLESLGNANVNSLVVEWLSKLPSGCKAIFTSRESVVNSTNVCRIQLVELEDDAAESLIRSQIANDTSLTHRFKRDEDKWRLLIRATYGLPLALINIVGLLRARASLDLDTAIKLIKEKSKYRDVLINFIFREARKNLSEDEFIALSALSFFSPSATFDAWKFVTDATSEALCSAIDSLSNLSLIQIIDKDIYRLHPLVVDFCQDELKEKTNLRLKIVLKFVLYWTQPAQFRSTQFFDDQENIDRAIGFLTLLSREGQLLNQFKDLNLREKQLTGSDINWEAFPELESLNPQGNPIRDVPAEIVNQGISSVQDYLAHKTIQQATKFYETKLIILGEGGAGKTTLARKLIDLQSPRPYEEETTWGIDIQNWSFSMKDGEPFRVNVWDFGGQQIYHQTHHLFFTCPSLYVVVVDSRKENNDLYYWLESVKLFGGNSPILIVSNEKEDRRNDLPERELRGKFEQLKGVMRTNLKTGRGLVELRNEIEHLLCALPHVGVSLPAGWVRVREVLEKDLRDYISQDDFMVLCLENGIDRREDALQLSGYLHDIGVILHFKDAPELCETVILKPEWATQAVYDVVQNAGVVRGGGRFTRADLNVIWSGERHKLKRPELLALMKNFHLCYEIVGQLNTFILPQFLSDDVPDYAPIAAPSTQLHYQYEFMPKGILAQLIVRMNVLIEIEHSEHFLVWKTGVILTKDGARAEVVEDRDRREIRVKVGGNTRNQLLSLIIYQIQEIHSSFRGELLVSELIPCVCEECGKGEPYFFSYGNLMKGIEKGISELQCQKSFEMVSIHKVLDGRPFGFSDLREVKDLLDKFNKGELEELLYDFRNLPKMRRMGGRLDLEAIGSHDMGKGQIIVRLLEYCDRHETLAALYRFVRSKRKSG